jgi:hypothetical protein
MFIELSLSTDLICFSPLNAEHLRIEKPKRFQEAASSESKLSQHISAL